jgi:hypothetical protein
LPFPNKEGCLLLVVANNLVVLVSEYFSLALALSGGRLIDIRDLFSGLMGGRRLAYIVPISYLLYFYPGFS